MSKKYTPGPWKAVKNSTYWEIRKVAQKKGDYDDQIGDACATGCRVDSDGYHGEEEEANARLMASAPELLRALVVITMDIERAWGNSIPVEMAIKNKNFRNARAAIAKARGVK